jgi:hypothetical protein
MSTFLDRLPSGSRAPDPREVVRDMLVAARFVGHYEIVREAAVTLHGDDLVASVEAELDPEVKT